MKKDEYQPRTYRHWIEGTDLAAFNITEKETDLYIRATSNLQPKARRITLKYRRQLEDYIARYPAFQTALEPYAVGEDAPLIVSQMAAAGRQAGVGPMAAVAGAIARSVGLELLEYSPEVIVENGGDVFLKVLRKRVVGIFAGASPLTGKVGLEISPSDTPLGICTSSGTVGHSLSYGRADAVIILAEDAALADAAATAAGNLVKKPADINSALEWVRGITGLRGAVIILRNDVGVWGTVKLCETSV
jgi:ApbE superfamily uncharacterized protein (UPF0280 family)